MVEKLEARYMGEFVASEAPGTLSREVGTLAQDAAPYVDGTVLMLSGGNLVRLAAGEETTEGGGTIDPASIVGILYGNYNASEGPVEAVYVARHAEVVRELLVYPPDDTGDTEGGNLALVTEGLALLAIRPR